MLGQLGDRRRMPELDVELLDRAVDREVEFLQPARNLDGPALIAEIALDLADDRRRRVGRELDAALEIEAVDRFEQPDRADLDQIVERFAAIGELDRQVARQVEVRDDEFAAQPLVLGLPASDRGPLSSSGRARKVGEASERLPRALAIPALRVDMGTELTLPRDALGHDELAFRRERRSCIPRCPSARG